jgi:hypothetical protein
LLKNATILAPLWYPPMPYHFVVKNFDFQA